MTRQHFEAIAATVRRNYEQAAEGPAKLAVVRLAHDLATDFRAFNLRFDSGRFLKACGIYGN